MEQALNILSGIPPVDRLVVCHGDACCPNTLLGPAWACWLAHVDLGGLGTADRWADLAVATWSTAWNYGPGWEPVLLDAYGVEPDPETYRGSPAHVGSWTVGLRVLGGGAEASPAQLVASAEHWCPHRAFLRHTWCRHGNPIRRCVLSAIGHVVHALGAITCMRCRGSRANSNAGPGFADGACQ